RGRGRARHERGADAGEGERHDGGGHRRGFFFRSSGEQCARIAGRLQGLYPSLFGRGGVAAKDEAPAIGVVRIEQLKRQHDELLWALSDGSKSEMDAWDRADVFEFFRGVLIKQDHIKRMLKESKRRADA